ncbi:hypothetical protein [Fusibacter ferrireducens]|uniref:Lipoprotein n=1 Tax=Fusibacter ferrireducens TaxID=2785058 RepID=A0ABS0A023_9FIRM|nr:hypothetical protein [Fusibacter ferrireducens]MBF4696056.1 hypothetical protein [Fusibacter ferrireducens]
MKRFTWAITLFVLSLLAIGCSNTYTDTNEDVPVQLSYDEIIENENATKGELLKIIRGNTEYKNNDGSYIVLNFNSIKKVGDFVTNRNDQLENVILIKNVSNLNKTKNFFNGSGYISLIDDYGNETYPEIWMQSGDEFTDILIVVESIDDFEKAKYLKLGGLDRELYKDKSVMIFKMD